MPGFTTDFQIIPASAILTARTTTQPNTTEQVLSILPGSFLISADTARLIATLTSAPIPLRLAA